MTTPARVPTPLPKAKATPTSGVSSESATASTASTAHSQQQRSGQYWQSPAPILPSAAQQQERPKTPNPRPHVPGPRPRAGARVSPALSGPLSDRATVLLIRRTLCSQQQQAVDKGRAASTTPAPIEDLLPPLTSRNDVDLQLYALIAILLREYVQTWYSNITAEDSFVADLVLIIAHITRALEQRLRRVDLERLLFDEIPGLLDSHITAYRASHCPVAHPPIQTNPRAIYHSLCPIPALSPAPCSDDLGRSAAEQADNETAYRQLLVQAVLAVLLPTEDLENDCLTALVGQILSELIIGNVLANRLSEPWMIWECFIILANLIGRKTAGHDAVAAKASRSSRGPGLFWSALHWCFSVVAVIRLLIAAVMASYSLPLRPQPSDTTRPKRGGLDSSPSPTPVPGDTGLGLTAVPVAAFRLWPAMSNLVELDTRMPLLHGTLSMLQWIAIAAPGRVADVNGILDRLASHQIRRFVLDPALLPTLLCNVRGALYPNNAPGTPTLSAPGSEAGLRALQRRCAAALWEVVPRIVGRLYYLGVTGAGALLNEAAGGERERDYSKLDSVKAGEPVAAAGLVGEEERVLEEIETGILDVFGDAYCNKHLVYSILELILVRLMPELSEKGVVELWEERLS